MMKIVIEMAKEAHHRVVTEDYPGHTGQLDPWTMKLLERFANLVAAQEREACAKLFDNKDIWAEEISQTIRARGNNMTEQKEWKPTKEWREWYLAPSVDYRKVYGDAFVWTKQEKQLMLLQKLKEQT